METPEAAEATPLRHLFQVLLGFAKHYKRQFFIVALFSFLYSGFDLLQPLIYKRAINDVAGLFVEQGAPAAAGAKPVREAHQAGRVAPRNAQQTLRTLVESAALLFVISLASYVFYLRSTYHGARVASYMESRLIVETFGHVLRLPLSFFDRQASGALAKRIDQSDQVAPVVHAIAQEIAPEAIRLVGICAIMLAQNWEMALVSVCLLPPYMWLARRSALRMRTNLDSYYDLWESISTRITDAVGAIKTVKLSGAEQREEDRLRAESTHAYDVYLDRIATAQRFSLLSKTRQGCGGGC